MNQSRVILADDDVLLREGLASLLDGSHFDVVCQVGDGSELLGLVREHRPDLVIVDIRMPPTHTTEGLDAAQAIRDAFPDVGIVVLSAHVEVYHALELLAAGNGIGYVLKSRVTNIEQFLETLDRTAGARPWWIRGSSASWCEPDGSRTPSLSSAPASVRYWR